MKYEKETDRIEDLVLMGAPVSAVVVPVVVQRHVFGSARGVPAPQTMDAVEEIPLVRVFVEQIVVCQYHRSWRFSSCRRSRRKSWR